MKFRILISIVLFVFSQDYVIGQRLAIDQNDLNNYLFGSFSEDGALSSQLVDYKSILSEYKTFKGTPFYKNKKILVDLITHDGNFVNNVTIRYDLFNNEILARKGEGEEILLDQVHYVEIIGKGKDKDFYMKKITRDGNDRFYSVLYANDEYIFYKDYVKEISNMNSSSYGVVAKKQFTSHVNYYILNNKKTFEIKLPKSELLRMVPAFREVNIDRAMKKYKIKKLKKESHYIELFKNLDENPMSTRRL